LEGLGPETHVQYIKLTTYTTEYRSYRIQNSEDRRQNTEYRTQNTEHRTQKHITSNVPAVYMVLNVMILMQAISITRAIGNALKSKLFWALK
jgi:hypothetical protein